MLQLCFSQNNYMYNYVYKYCFTKLQPSKWGFIYFRLKYFTFNL